MGQGILLQSPVFWLGVICASAVGVVLGYWLRRFMSEAKLGEARTLAQKIVADSQKEAREKIKEAELEAKNELLKSRLEFEKETRERRAEQANLEKRLLQKEENFEKRVEMIEKKEANLEKKDRAVQAKEKEIQDKEQSVERILKEETENLLKIANMTREEAQREVLSRVENEVAQSASALIRRIEGEAKETAEKRAKEIISRAIQRCAGEHTAEVTVATVALPNDEMKGRIIGREGRNIRALEAATGIDIIVDDTPETVVLSGFDNIRKEIARITLERLIIDGRIHPARIEEVVNKVKSEVDETIRTRGEQAVFEVGLQGIHPEIVKLLGKLSFRTSYGQNVLKHSVEVAHLMGMMASDLNEDIKLSKRAGLLHDIGKVLGREIEGGHAVIGADFAKKYGESPEVVHAIRSHHNDEEPKTLLAFLLAAADAISGARPGARSESLELYINRLGKLEEIAVSFKGVEKAFAIQAGREMRVLVDSSAVREGETELLARSIAKKIEENVEYPGQVKVVVIRETRDTSIAK